MDEQKQDDQLEPTYSISMPIRDVVLKTYRKQWAIGRGGERESEISILIARYDDDDDNTFVHNIYIYIYIGLALWTVNKKRVIPIDCRYGCGWWG